MAPKIKFTDVELIAALNAHTGNVTKAAAELGVSRAAVIKRRDVLPQAALISKDEWEIKKADAMSDMQHTILASITQDDIEKSSAAQRITMMAILEDKLRLIQGKATEHIAHAVGENLSDEYKKELKEFIQRETARKRAAVTYEEGE